MPRRRTQTGLYQRGDYWLDWDKRADGSLRSPYLTVFWYDKPRGRYRSASTGTGDVRIASAALDARYLESSHGQAFCPTCGQARQAGGGYLLTQAIMDYLTTHAPGVVSAKAIHHRLQHVIAYVGTLDDSMVVCDAIDERWVERFRGWAIKQPIVSPTGLKRQRSPATVENSVLQLAAVINAAHKARHTLHPPAFKAMAPRDVNRTPTLRLTEAQLAAAFRFALGGGDAEARAGLSPEQRTFNARRRVPLLRFLQASVATLSRPDAAYSLSVDPALEQWHSDRRVIALNPRGRRQTKKYRATVRAPRQFALLLDAHAESVAKIPNKAEREWASHYVPVQSVRGAWRTMAADLGLPGAGAAGEKLIRRSVAQLLRDAGCDETELEYQLGHRSISSTSDLYAAFNPTYLKGVTAALEALIDRLDMAAPGAFSRSFTGAQINVVELGRAKK